MQPCRKGIPKMTAIKETLIFLQNVESSYA